MFAQRICVQLDRCLLCITEEIVIFLAFIFVKCIQCFTRCKFSNCNKFPGRFTCQLIASVMTISKRK